MKNLRQLQKGDTRLTFLETGDLYEIESHGMMINQILGNPLDGSLNQIYLRQKNADSYTVTPLIGSNTDSQFFADETQLTWQGMANGIDYQVAIQLSEHNCWFWQVTLVGEGTVDVIYGQDLGNATKGAVQSNEAYVSQYIDHHISYPNSHKQTVVTSRQNQPQDGKFPAVEQGSLQTLRAFSTDGYQFFKRAYKKTNQPQALLQGTLDNEVYQYEFAYIALQSETVDLTNQPQELVFYAATKESQEEAVNAPLFAIETISSWYHELTFTHPDNNGVTFTKQLGAPIVGEEFSKEELQSLYPEQTEVEEDGQNTPYSFFTKDYHHVVLPKKEVAMERTHGHILLSGTDLDISKPLLSTTVYMPGLFNSQIVLGNTNMHKLLGNSRNSLNLSKLTGQRLYILEAGTWRLLTMPTAFEMGLNSATWTYKLADDLLTIRTYTVSETREVRLEVASRLGKVYTWALSNQLLMGPDDTPHYQIDETNEQLTIRSTHPAVQEKYPGLTYYVTSSQPFEMTDGSLFTNHTDDQLLVLKLADTAQFNVTIQGTLTGQPYTETQTDFSQEETTYRSFIDGLLHQFSLSHETVNVNRMNLLTRWYTHNMLVHYLSPHGLEQYGGAAWGTRDVSQGPTEFFLAVNRPEIVQSIIKNVYANQFEEDGNWPQWFMFDRYQEQKADESHGDIIVWPMKIVADYLEKTNDFSILNEEIPYTLRSSFQKTKKTIPLYQHIQKEIAYIEANFLEGTFLSCYGDGDWDDTLQPYDSRLKKSMASSWTVALTYQVIKKLGALLATFDAAYSQKLTQLSQSIKADFEKYVLASETIPGFLYQTAEHEFEQMVYPGDNKTHIHYRLLPMTRSMIAELLTPQQVSHHLKLIRKHLQFPDGVRLMNRPASYNGGVSTHFKRAEQSANFGREIGLQYVHAHIRFAEAMAKIGETEEAWHALEIINPISIADYVPNAEMRQANVYFSSSDGDFKTRLEAQENFGKLKDGTVGVKGGWRIYSSGPGIYLNQLLTAVLGIREQTEQVVFDPILPKELDGLSLNYQLFGKPVTITFHLNRQAAVEIDGKPVTFTREENPYRTGGLCVSRTEFTDKKEQHIDIYR
ncbi:cellobiose phosphorylase [Enterococcus sp. JM4C]|uniref:GH36-type glycosyl hydrolase domain-containing protein n=1 Tax=Candidatus Enterococcus huntleyi TaxID=1857217 RepID=UPI0013794032|nr:cellobiose phosphorylase [Enterococcus sp. JM4C]KAF1297505.1 cellobiose phosphorylase [Enterococcus sp. JM4C]